MITFEQMFRRLMKQAMPGRANWSHARNRKPTKSERYFANTKERNRRRAVLARASRRKNRGK